MQLAILILWRCCLTALRFPSKNIKFFAYKENMSKIDCIYLIFNLEDKYLGLVLQLGAMF